MNQVTDPYKTFASEIFGVPLEQVTTKQRKYAKLHLYHTIYNHSYPYFNEYKTKLNPTSRRTGSPS